MPALDADGHAVVRGILKIKALEALYAFFLDEMSIDDDECAQEDGHVYQEDRPDVHEGPEKRYATQVAKE